MFAELLIKWGPVWIVIESLRCRNIWRSILINGVVRVSAAAVGYIRWENSWATPVWGPWLIVKWHVIRIVQLDVLLIQHGSDPLGGDHLMQLLAWGERLPSESQLHVWKLRKVLIFLVLAVLKHIEHILSLLKLSRHLICLQLFWLKNGLLEV